MSDDVSHVAPDIPQPGKKISCHVDQLLYEDLVVIMGGGMKVSDAIKYGIAKLAMSMRSAAVKESSG